jgi:hypothetical protein
MPYEQHDPFAGKCRFAAAVTREIAQIVVVREEYPRDGGLARWKFAIDQAAFGGRTSADRGAKS